MTDQRDENGNEGFAICGRPHGAQPPDNQEDTNG